MKFQKFYVGDAVKVVRLVGHFPIEAEKHLVGKKSIVEEVDDLPNGDYNYRLTDGYYVHEEELELDVPEQVIRRLQEGL